MYAIKLFHGNHFFHNLAAARRFQKRLEVEQNLIVDIYKRVENQFTGFVRFEKIA